jgi:PAS domain S-box-containing protein
MTIRRHLLRLVLACIIPAWLVAAVLIVLAYNNMRTASEDHLQYMARAMSTAVDREMATFKASLHSLAASPALNSNDFAEFHREAASFAHNYEGFSIVLTDANGQQVVDSLYTFGSPPRQRPVTDAATAVIDTGREVIGNLWSEVANRGSQFSVEVPVRRGGKVAYSLGLNVPAEQFNRLLAEQDFGRFMLAAVIDASGHIVTRYPYLDSYVGRTANPPLLAAMARADEGLTDIETFEGFPATAAFVRSRASGWTVVVGFSKATLTAELTSWLWWIAGATVLGAVVGLGLALRIGGGISLSIAALRAPATALGRGETVRVPAMLLDETNEVGQALVLASERLRQQAADRDRAESALKLTQFAVDHADEAIFFVTPGGRIIVGNHGAEKMLGYTSEQLRTLTVRDLNPGRGDENWDDHWRNLVREGVLHYSADLYRSDGSKFPAEITANHVKYEGKEYGVSFARDVTERRQREQDLRRALKAAEELTVQLRSSETALVGKVVELNKANAALEEFAQILAHHLQEPVRQQYAFAQRLERILPAPLADDAQRALDFVLDGALRQRALLRDVQLYFAIDKLPHEHGLCRSNAALDAAIHKLDAKIQAGNAMVEAGELPGLRINETRLAEVFTILVENSLHYGHQGVPVRVCVAVESRDGRSIVTVTDNGIGVAAEFHERVFKVFERLYPEKSAGTGIGLALARRIIEAAAGTIWIETPDDGGTRVCFALPTDEE